MSIQRVYALCVSRCMMLAMAVSILCGLLGGLSWGQEDASVRGGTHAFHQEQIDALHPHLIALALVDEQLDIIRVEMSPGNEHDGPALAARGIVLDTPAIAEVWHRFHEDTKPPEPHRFWASFRLPIKVIQVQSVKRGSEAPVCLVFDHWQALFQVEHEPIADHEGLAVHKSYFISDGTFTMDPAYPGPDGFEAFERRIAVLKHLGFMASMHRQVSERDPMGAPNWYADRPVSGRGPYHGGAQCQWMESLLVVQRCEDTDSPFIAALRAALPPEVPIYRQVLLDHQPGLATLAYNDLTMALAIQERPDEDLPQRFLNRHITFETADMLERDPPGHSRRENFLSRNWRAFGGRSASTSSRWRSRIERADEKHAMLEETMRGVHMRLPDDTAVFVPLVAVSPFSRDLALMWDMLTQGIADFKKKDLDERGQHVRQLVEAAHAIRRSGPPEQVRERVLNYFDERNLILTLPPAEPVFSIERGSYLLPYSFTTRDFARFHEQSKLGYLTSFSSIRYSGVGADPDPEEPYPDPPPPRDPMAGLLDQPAPAWASATGVDAYGAWAELTVGDQVQRLRWITPGTFTRGSPIQEGREREYNEGPMHQVTISRGFWMADSECTQGLWLEVMGENPSHFHCASMKPWANNLFVLVRDPDTAPAPNVVHPVENVSWNDCQRFIRRLQERIPDLQVALPTEAEWEYACRAGTVGPHAGDLEEIAWLTGQDPPIGSRPVRSKQPNAWGLYDMHGNVWEWCADWFGLYPEEPVVDPIGPETGQLRILRGGDWICSDEYARSAQRFRAPEDHRFWTIGFRFIIRDAD